MTTQKTAGKKKRLNRLNSKPEDTRSDVNQLRPRSRGEGDSSATSNRDLNARRTDTIATVDAQHTNANGADRRRTGSNVTPVPVNKVSQRRRNAISIVSKGDSAAAATVTKNARAQVRDDSGDQTEHRVTMQSRSARNARNYTNRLVNAQGQLEASVFNVGGPAHQLLAELANATEANSPHTRHVSAMLGRLQQEPVLREALNSLTAPQPDSPMHDIVRSTLGLTNDEAVTAAHVRKAALSALLVDLRQSDVGSCFGTCVAIRTQMIEPARFLADIAALTQQGGLSRTVPQIVKRRQITAQTFTPMSRQTSRSALHVSVEVDDSGTLSGSPANEVNKLHELPGFAEALSALGIASNDHAATVATAVQAMGASSSKKLKLMPEEVIEEIVARQVGIGGRAALIIDRKNAAEATQLAAEIRRDALRGADTPLANDQIRIVRYEQLVGDLQTRQRRANFEQAFAKATDAFVAMTDNRLLRAWEFTVTSMAEAAEGAKRQQQILDPLISRTHTVIVKTLGFEGGDTLMDNFSTLAKARLRIVWDADIASTGTLDDGHSTRGGWRLVDINGSDSPTDWVRIEDASEFVATIRGLLLESSLDATRQPRGQAEPLRDAADRVAQRLDDPETILRPLIETLNPGQPTGTGLSADELAQFKTLPWRALGGGHAPSVIQTYFETIPQSQDVTIATGSDLSGLADLLITRTFETASQAQATQTPPDRWANVMSSPTHAFLFRPGLGPLAELATQTESSFDRAAWLDATLPPLSTARLSQHGMNRAVDSFINKVSGVLRTKAQADDLEVQAFQQSLRTFTSQAFSSYPITHKELRDKLQDFATNHSLTGAGTKALMNYIVQNPDVHSFISDDRRAAIRPRDLDQVLRDTLTKLRANLSLAAAVRSRVDLSKPVPMVELEAAVVQALGATAPSRESEIIDALLAATAEPATLPFADTNWGNATRHDFLALARDPDTDKLVLRQVDQDGKGAKPSQLRNPGTWAVFNDPLPTT